MFINTFVDQEFVDKYNLFVVGKRINLNKGVIEWYIRSKKAEDYKKMILEQLYHPPDIRVNKDKAEGNELYLDHNFEGKQLVKKFIPMTMIGIEHLWGDTVKLETSEIDEDELERLQREIQDELYSTGILDIDEFLSKQDIKFERVVYTMKDKELSRKRYSDKKGKNDGYYTF